MKYKLLVCDFDGTLYTDDFKVTQNTIDAVEKYKQAGGKFVIATGRLYQAIKPFAQLFNLTDEIVTYQGSGVYDIKTDSIILSNEIENKLAIKLYQYVYATYGEITSPILFYEDKCIVEEENEYNKIFSQIVKVPLTCVNKKLDIYVADNNIDARKILFLADEKFIRHIINDLINKFGDQLNVNQSSKALLECVNINASKANAIKWIAEKYNINQDEICAIGDSENDNSMIEYAGLGVAMGNAMEITKKVADYICDTNNNDGVAKFIEQVILKY